MSVIVDMGRNTFVEWLDEGAHGSERIPSKYARHLKNVCSYCGKSAEKIHTLVHLQIFTEAKTIVNIF